MPRSIAQEVPPLVKLLNDDQRYKLEAYQFVRAGLAYAQDILGMGQESRPGQEPRPVKKGRQVRHVSGQDLCVAMKQLAHEQYGYMARLVLASWGIRSTSDFGEIVYNLIRIGEMTKSEGDRREDFDDVYDFDTALIQDYAIAHAES